MAGDRINDRCKQNGCDDETAKGHAFCNRPGEDRHRSAAKGQLEKKEGNQPNIIRRCIKTNAWKETARADDTIIRCPKHQAKAHRPKQEARNTKVTDIFQRNIDGVFRADEARLQTDKPCLH